MKSRQSTNLNAGVQEKGTPDLPGGGEVSKKLTAIEKYLMTVKLPALRTLKAMAAKSQLRAVSTCKCLLGVVGGGTEEGYQLQCLNKFADSAETAFFDLGDGDAARNSNLLPLVDAELKRRKSKRAA